MYVTSRDDYPKVLVAIPTYEGKDYIFHENFKCIKALQYPNWDYIYIDNSPTMDYYLKLRRRGAKVAHVPRGSNSRQALCNSQNYARKKCLDEGYDFLMFIESDLLPPPESIQRLVNHDQRIVGAVYYIGHEVKVPCIFFKYFDETKNSYATRLISLKEVPTFLFKGLQKVHGMGLGCTLIRRDLVERFPFWHDERFDNKHSDVYFYMELENTGISVAADSDFIVPHFPSKWEQVLDK